MKNGTNGYHKGESLTDALQRAAERAFRQATSVIVTCDCGQKNRVDTLRAMLKPPICGSCKQPLNPPDNT